MLSKLRTMIKAIITANAIQNPISFVILNLLFSGKSKIRWFSSFPSFFFLGDQRYRGRSSPILVPQLLFPSFGAPTRTCTWRLHFTIVMLWLSELLEQKLRCGIEPQSSRLRYGALPFELSQQAIYSPNTSPLAEPAGAGGTGARKIPRR